jgi:hypothetical protein
VDARFIHPSTFALPRISMGVVMGEQSTFDFLHAETGMTRFPPNVEQITVERESTRAWLVAWRNDVTLRFHLTEADCQYLAKLLTPRM